MQIYGENNADEHSVEMMLSHKELSAACSPKQRKMIIAFIEMRLEHDEFE